MDLNGNTFVLTNKHYHHANLAQWGSGAREMGTFELKVHPDQFWRLEEDPTHSGYYTINNARWEGFRLYKWGEGNEEVGVYDGKYYDDQLWRFEQVEGDYYRIYSFRFPSARLTKSGRENENLSTYTGEYYDDQIWKLVPRFEAKVEEHVLWATDNRQGSQDFSEEITVTTGLKLTSSSTISTKKGLEVALTASISYLAASVEVQTKINSEISRSLSQGEEKSWSRTSKVKFTAPKGKNYRVLQLGCEFTSPLADDNCALGCNYVVEESESDFSN